MSKEIPEDAFVAMVRSRCRDLSRQTSIVAEMGRPTERLSGSRLTAWIGLARALSGRT